LALELGCSLAEIEAMPHAHYIRWRAYMKWRAVQREHAANVAAARAR
jgi:hypothetical protein